MWLSDLCVTEREGKRERESECVCVCQGDICKLPRTKLSRKNIAESFSKKANKKKKERTDLESQANEGKIDRQMKEIDRKKNRIEKKQIDIKYRKT